jgi:hypothetical protein
MKRVMMAIAGAGLVITAIVVARANSGEDSAPDAHPSSTSAPGEPTREILREQLDRQSAQMLQAQQDLKDKVEQQSRLLRERQHSDD